MDRMEMAKKFYAQAQKITIGMAASVVVYGVIGYYLIHIGKAGPAILNVQTYLLVKYGALLISAVDIFVMWQVSNGMLHASEGVVPNTERSLEKQEGIRLSSQGGSPQRIFLRTVIMSAGAEMPVLLGMLLVFFGRHPYDYIPFAAISLIGFVLAFPQKAQWSSWLGVDL